MPNQSSISPRGTRESSRDSRGSVGNLLDGSIKTASTIVPKLVLLTVADPPKLSHELWADVADLTPVGGWLKSHDGSLDGVYLQFQPQMLTQEGATELRKLAEQFDVGVWGYNGRDPDDHRTFRWLVDECHVSFVNSDLPKKFMQPADE